MDNSFPAFLVSNDILKTGEFTLKSGQRSPYFFDFGAIQDGQTLHLLGAYFAHYIHDHFPINEHTIIFGPAYKGISLAIATAIAMQTTYNTTIRFAYNRKEPKRHGEGSRSNSLLMGTPIRPGDHMILIDDVLTTSETKIEAINDIRSAEASVVFEGCLIAVDRQEITEGGGSQATHFATTTGIPVHALTTLSDIYRYLIDTEILTAPGQKESFLDYMTQYTSCTIPHSK